MAEESIDETRLGEVATRVLFENERVRVWEMSLEPGEASDFHRHDHEYFFVVLESQSIDADFANGKSIRLPVEPLKVFYVPAGNAETAVNRSPVRYREILVELLEPRAA
jgi:hypothetical protein